MTKQRKTHLNVFSKEDIQQSSSDPKTVLSKIFRTLVYATGRNPVQKWNELMENYIQEVKKTIELNAKALGYTRGNTKSELMNPKMSWNVFCKGLRFLKFKSFRIIIIATDEQNRSFYTVETVNIAQNEDDDNFTIDNIDLPKIDLSEEKMDEWLVDIINKNTKKE